MIDAATTLGTLEDGDEELATPGHELTVSEKPFWDRVKRHKVTLVAVIMIILLLNIIVFASVFGRRGKGGTSSGPSTNEPPVAFTCEWPNELRGCGLRYKRGAGTPSSIPSIIGLATQLTSLVLENNQLTGTIPSEIGSLTALISLHLYDNQLTGTIPSEIGALTELMDLDLYENQLTGTIPSEIGTTLTALTYLGLYDNRLTGIVPPALCLMSVVPVIDCDELECTCWCQGYNFVAQKEFDCPAT